jgi:hypothetical protein
MPVGRGGEERVGTEAAAGVNSGTVVTGHEGEAGGKLKTFMEGRRMERGTGAQGREGRRLVERADGEARGERQDGDVKERNGRGGFGRSGSGEE